VAFSGFKHALED